MTSALLLEADSEADFRNVGSGPIVLQKSKVAGSRIFGENTKRGAIADSHRRNRIVEVACEFNVRRRGPSHTYTKDAPTAFRIFDHQCKTTFATQSALSRPNRLSLFGRSHKPGWLLRSGSQVRSSFGGTQPATLERPPDFLE
jgi:hypothetical protein